MKLSLKEIKEYISVHFPLHRFILVCLCMIMWYFSIVLTFSEAWASPIISYISLKPTIFYKEINDEPMQVANLTVYNNDSESQSDAYLQIDIDGSSHTYPVGVLQGGSETIVEVYIPPINVESAEVTVSLFLSSDHSMQFSKTLPWQRQRLWRLYLVPYSHLDVGFTQTQEKVRVQQMKNIDIAMDLVDLTLSDPAYNEDSIFRYTCEESWPVIEYVKDRPDSQVERFFEYVKKGYIEVTGFYISHTNKFMGDEPLIRSTYFSAERLAREYEIEVVSAIINDVFDASSIVQPLARSGIRYFQLGSNTSHYSLPPLFYLSTPVGDGSKILVWHAPNLAGYCGNFDLNLYPDLPFDFDAAYLNYRSKIEKTLERLQNKGIPLSLTTQAFDYRDKTFDYPYDAYLVPFYPAHAVDNGPQDITPSEIARDWNSRYVYPRMIVATQRKFFECIESNFKDMIPSLSGDMIGFWGEQIFYDILQADPKKEARAREFTNLLSAGETFSTIAKELDQDFDYPGDVINNAYSKIILNNDHNPGPVPFGNTDYSQEDVDEWQLIHQSWAEESYDAANQVLDDALGVITRNIPCPASNSCLIIFNTASWWRSEPVTVVLNLDDQDFSIIDPITDKEIPYQITRKDDSSISGIEVVFIARDVPSVGYKLFEVIEGKSPTIPASDLSADMIDNEVILENRQYRITISSDSMAITSLYDKELDVELVDQSAEYYLNQYVSLRRNESGPFVGGTLTGLGGCLSHEPGYVDADIAIKEAGPVRGSVVITGTAADGMYVKQEVYLSSNIKRIDFTQTFSKAPLQNSEHAFAYAFNIPGSPNIEIELPYNPIRFGPHDPFDIYGLRPEESGDEFISLKMIKPIQTVNATNEIFLWMDGIPPSNIFQHWMDISNNEFGITFSSRESGSIIIGDFEHNPYRSAIQNSFYHVCVGPTGWGNLGLGVKEGETYSFHSTLTSHKGNWKHIGKFSDSYTAAQFGWSFTNPLVARQIFPSESGSLPHSRGFIQIDTPNVILSTMKRAEDGDGIILRLYETNGISTKATISVPFATEPFYVTLTDNVERNLNNILSDDEQQKSFSLCLKPGMVATVRISSEPKSFIPVDTECERNISAGGCSCDLLGSSSYNDKEAFYIWLLQILILIFIWNLRHKYQ